MDLGGDRGPVHELRQILREATRALSLLNAERLEELAVCCDALNGALRRDPAAAADMAAHSRRAIGDMAVFAHVLEATRGNVAVMQRLREEHEALIEYRVPAGGPRLLLASEAVHGNH